MARAIVGALVLLAMLAPSACDRPMTIDERRAVVVDRVVADAEREIGRLAADVRRLQADLTGLPATRSPARVSFVELAISARRLEPYLVGRIETHLHDRALRGDDPDVDRLEALLRDASRPLEVPHGTTVSGLASLEWLMFVPEPDAAGRLDAILDRQVEAIARVAHRIRHDWFLDSDAVVEDIRGNRGDFPDHRAVIEALVNRAVMLAVRLRDRDLAPYAGATAGGVVQRLGPRHDPSGSMRRQVLAGYEALQRLYLGAEDDGLTLLVSGANTRIDAGIRTALADMIAALKAAPDPLASAAPEDRQRLHDLATLVKARIGVDLVAALDVTINFSLADGD